MKLGNVIESLHGGERSFRIFLQLLVVRTVLIHLPVPVVDATAQLSRIQPQQEWPYQFAVDETVEALLSSVCQQFAQSFYIVFRLS